MTKRHAKPTSAQLVARIYRKVVAMDSLLTDTIDANGEALDAINSKLGLLMERVSSLNPIVDHCARLLKEKETLQRQVEMSRKGRNTDWDWREKMAADIMNSSFEGSPDDGMPKVSSTRHIDIMQPPIPTLNFEMRQYPCGCSATGNGIQPLPDYCGTHGVLTDSVVTRHRVPACTVAHLHRPGIRCGVCGETPDGMSYDLT
jgi:hypothetical protein